jgi:hypothetical protein
LVGRLGRWAGATLLGPPRRERSPGENVAEGTRSIERDILEYIDHEGISTVSIRWAALRACAWWSSRPTPPGAGGKGTCNAARHTRQAFLPVVCEVESVWLPVR